MYYIMINRQDCHWHEFSCSNQMFTCTDLEKTVQRSIVLWPVFHFLADCSSNTSRHMQRRRLDEEEAVGCWAGTGLQPPHTPPHTPASRVSHRLPLERLSSVGIMEGGRGQWSPDFSLKPRDKQRCPLVVVLIVTNQIQEIHHNRSTYR